MKQSKTLSAVLAGALAIAGVLLVGPAASASTVVGEGTFYGASDFGTETSSYPSGVDWFFGDASGTDGPHAFTADGLELNGDASGNVQILNQNVGTQPATAAAFIDLVGTMAVASDDDSTWTLQIPMFAEGTTPAEFTTLRPSFTGNIDNSDPGSEVWVTSRAFGAYAANDTDTLADFADAIFAGEAPLVLGYGLWVGAADTAVIQAFHWGDDSSYFLPAPTRTISGTSFTIDQITTTGFTLTGTNWMPNADIYLEITDPDGDDVSVPDPGDADASGNVSVHIVLSAPVKPGTYTVTFDDDGFYFNSDVFGDPFTTFEVLAPELAATGAAESAPALGAAGLVMLAGLLLVVGARRRRARA
jgi:LPXTG-motif cell wall-anchored protein